MLWLLVSGTEEAFTAEPTWTKSVDWAIGEMKKEADLYCGWKKTFLGLWENSAAKIIQYSLYSVVHCKNKPTQLS